MLEPLVDCDPADETSEVCDVCKKDKPIVLVCLIGMRLCAGCQKKQDRISYTELRG